MKRTTLKDVYCLTYDQVNYYEEKLRKYKLERRPAILQKLRMAKEQMDSEAYEKAINEQKNCEKKISEFEHILSHIVAVADEERVIPFKIILGCQVLVYDKEYDEEIRYSIVDALEGDVLKNKISDQSPLGKALLGKKAGDVVSVLVENASFEYKIVRIVGMEIGYSFNVKDAIKEIQKKINMETEAVKIHPGDFVTRVNVFHCTNRKHKISDVHCHINLINRIGRIESTIVPGAYCETCNKYFLLEGEYVQLRENGIPMCKIVEMDFWTNSGSENNFYHLNNESLLHLMGYNVNAQENLPVLQRRAILEMIVDEGILSLTEVRSHLRWLIRKNRNNKNCSAACVKWEEDCDYLAGYATNTKSKVAINSITRKKYIKE